MKIEVHVTAGAKNDSIEVSSNLIKVKTKEPAKEGRANARIIKVLAGLYKVPVSRVRIVRGHKSKIKLIEIL